MTNKESLRQSLLNILNTQRQTALEAANSAHDAATHEQSVAETQYDTVGLEAAYLAHGQSQRVADCDATINTLTALTLHQFDKDDEIALGALVSLRNDIKKYWFLPVCGGIKLDSGNIVVITPHSPLGEKLDGAELHEVLDDGRVIIAIE
ncbi:hypothetical protein [Vibrio gallicus]|uniref:hypothetical protein n=1 Tax=Vibrio gallicus TaxID=190897 RepID=UPI0021C2F628|nr:hypothetical protein [Vibrio gallicus]